MRAGAILFVVLVGGAPRVQAAPPPEPTPAQKTELDRLDKELRD